jgi:hypothetical protein
MKHVLKYIIVWALASLLLYVFLSVFIQSRVATCISSLIIATCILLLIRKLIAKYEFSFVFMVSIFLFILTVPMLGKKETTSLEKRTLADFPKFDINYIWGFTYGFADYFNDRFAYRNASISFLGKLKYHALHESPMPNLVEIGKDSFFFYTPIVYVHDISEPFTLQQLDTIRTNLDIITKWFDSKGIKYYLTIPPSKEHIYPELMSAGLQYRTKFSRLNQLADFIKDDTIIRFIDYRKELIENKKTRLTYEETDSHWNKFGAFFAYHKIMERMKKDFPIIRVAELADYKMDSVISVGGDLQRHLGFDDMFTMHYYMFTPKDGAQPSAADSSKYYSPDLLVEVREMQVAASGNTNNISACPLKLFVVRDSYSDALKGFFNTQFRRSVFAWTKTPPVGMIMQEHPDIILHEILERFLDATLKLPEDIAKDSAFIKQNFPQYYKPASVN